MAQDSIILLWNATDVLTDTSVHTQLAEVEVGLHSDNPIPSVDEQHGGLENNERAHEDDNGKLCQLPIFIILLLFGFASTNESFMQQKPRQLLLCFVFFGLAVYFFK